MVAVSSVRLKVGFAGFGVTSGWSADCKDALDVAVDVGINNRLQSCRDLSDVQVCNDVGSTNPSDHCGDIAVEIQEARRGHGFPVVSNGCSVFPVVLKPLGWKEVNVLMLFPKLLELADATTYFFQGFGGPA